MNKGSRIIAGTRRVVRIGGSLVISLPAELCRFHQIRQGDDLLFAVNHIMKIIPMPEGMESVGSEEPQREEGGGGKRQ